MTDRTAAEALRKIKQETDADSFVFQLADEAFAALTAEAATPSGARRLTASPSNKGENAQPEGGMATGSRPRVSLDREALARELDAAARWMRDGTGATPMPETLEDAAAALRLPAQAEVEAVLRPLIETVYAMDVNNRPDDYTIDMKTGDLRQLLVTLRRLSSLPPAVGEWRPIASAPKDGTRIDLWADGQRWPSCRWGRHDAESECPWGEPHWRFCYSDSLPTHWMPLPPAPPQETKP